MTIKPIHVIGGGLAGSEAAWQVGRGRRARGAARNAAGASAPPRTRPAGWPNSSVPIRSGPTTGSSMRSGLLHAEMRRCNSLILACGDANQVPAGGALAVDREGFSEAVTERLERHPRITIERGEVAGLPPADWDSVIMATGPLTSPALSQAILELSGEGQLSLLRRHRADRARREHRLRHRLAPVALRQGRPRRAMLRPMSTVRWTRRSTRPSCRRCSTGRSPSSRTGSTCPISTAACRSR